MRLTDILDFFRRAVTQPRSELTQWQRAARSAYELGIVGARQLRRDSAPQMAAALSFRTLFGLLPVLVVGTMLVRAIGGTEQFISRLKEFFEGRGLHQITINSAGTAERAPSVGGAADQTLSDWLLQLVRQAEHYNLAAVTWIGVAVLIYSATSLMVTIEQSFGHIYRAPEGRSWWRRFTVYWTILTLGPAAVAATMYADSVADRFIEETVSWSLVLRTAPVIWSFTALWLVMFAIYKLLPTTQVRTHSALAGAFVAAILLELGKRTVGSFLGNMIALQQLYGSLGLIPLFMFWVYLMWLAILFGLEVSAILQTLGGRSLDELEHERRPTGLLDPASVLVVMEVIATRFHNGRPSTARLIADETGLPEVPVRVILTRLADCGFIHRLEREDGGVVLAQPPEAIDVAALMDVGFALADEGNLHRRPALLGQLRAAQRAIAGTASLAALAGGGTVPGPPKAAKPRRKA